MAFLRTSLLPDLPELEMNVSTPRTSCRSGCEKREVADPPQPLPLRPRRARAAVEPADTVFPWGLRDSFDNDAYYGARAVTETSSSALRKCVRAKVKINNPGQSCLLAQLQSFRASVQHESRHDGSTEAIRRTSLPRQLPS